MKKMLLLVDGPPGQHAGKSGEQIIMHWEQRDIAAGEYSLASLLDSEIIHIRREHMRWAWQTGISPAAGGQLANELECGASPSMWWTSLIYERHPKVTPCLYPIYKLRRLEMFMDAQDISSLELCGGDARLAQTLQSLCAAKNTVFIHTGGSMEDGNSGWLKKIYNRIPAPLRALVRYAHWWWTVRRHLPPLKTLPAYSGKEGSRPASIISYFPNIDLQAAGMGRFRSRYWEDLHEALNEAAKRENPGGPHFVRWVFIRFPAPHLSFAQCRELCRTFARKGADGLSFNYLEEFLSFKDLRASFARWWRLCLKSAHLEKDFRQKCHFDGSALNFWPYLKETWAESFRGWRCLERCLQNQAFRSYYKLAGRQRWNLFPLENCPWERMLTESARAINGNGPVYGAQHSIIRPTDFRYFDDPETFAYKSCNLFQPDIFGANGASGLGQWLDAGMPKSRSRQLEALRYLYLANMQDEKTGDDSRLPPEPGEPLQPPASRRLLVLTSFFRDETEAHLELLGQALLSGALDGWQVSIKPHPYLPVDDWLATLPANIAANVRIVSAPLALVLEKDMLAWASNSTTASLEAAIKGMPLMVMAPANDFDLCPIQNIPGLARTETLRDVKAHLDKLPYLEMPAGYLDLEPGLRQWRDLLGL